MAKRILILGAGEAQLNLIKCAKELGYYVVVCDSRPEMEGSKIVDRYYEQDYMDRNAIYQIAVKEAIDGVISNSEPAMINVSYLVDRLGLPGNSEQSIEYFLSKNSFRQLQQANGLFAPSSITVNCEKDVLEAAKRLQFPIVIKPAQSSGSRGVTRVDIYSIEEVLKAFALCEEFSRDGEVILEEFVEMHSLNVINADVFVTKDEILWDGWYGGLRSPKRPLIPMAKILPPDISENDREKIVHAVNSLLISSGVELGEFNVESYFMKNGEPFIIEVNPRQAGDNIPQLIKEHTGVDLTRLLVSLSVNDRSYYEYLKTFKRENNYIILQVVFSNSNGIYQGLYIDEQVKENVLWIAENVSKGGNVYEARSAADAVAYVELRFRNAEEQRRIAEQIENYLYALVEIS